MLYVGHISSSFMTSIFLGRQPKVSNLQSGIAAAGVNSCAWPLANCENFPRGCTFGNSPVYPATKLAKDALSHTHLDAFKAAES